MKKCAVVIEDFRLIAQAWGRLLEKTNRFSNVQLFFDADGIEQKIINLDPAIILMDVNLPNSKNGIEISKKLLEINPNLNIIILTMHNEPIYVKKAFEAGAKGFVTKNSPINEINKAIDEIMNGNHYICEEVATLSSL